MLSPEEDMEANALHRQGWTISAIARHLGHHRTTIRGYINGKQEPGKRKVTQAGAFDLFAEYTTARLKEDPHLWATALFDEIRNLGYSRSYQRFTHELRHRGLRPHCEPCDGVRGRVTIDIEHKPGDEIQWDFLQFPSPWAEGGLVHLLVGALSYSGKTRAFFSESEDQAHLLQGIDEVLRRFGGTARRWRFDRMSAVVTTKTGRVLPSFLAAAKYYGVCIDICPPRRGNRKGVVESRNHFIAQRWWRTAAVANPEEAQTSLDAFCVRVADAQPRFDSIVHAVAKRETLMTLPLAPFPATATADRTVNPMALVSYRGNRYAASPGLVDRHVVVRTRLDSDVLELVVDDGTVVATHRQASPGSGTVVRTPEQRRDLERAVLSSFNTDKPCRRKENRPPGMESLAAAVRLRAGLGDEGDAVVVDLAQYARVAEQTP